MCLVLSSLLAGSKRKGQLGPCSGMRVKLNIADEEFEGSSDLKVSQQVEARLSCAAELKYSVSELRPLYYTQAQPLKRDCSYQLSQTSDHGSCCSRSASGCSLRMNGGNDGTC